MRRIIFFRVRGRKRVGSEGKEEDFMFYSFIHNRINLSIEQPIFKKSTEFVSNK